MPPDVSQWLGDIHQCMPSQWAGVLVTVTAVLCGAVVGFERERAQKPVGMRTLALICLGSAIFTQASILMATGGSDRTRIAAQIVTGIGFLGAGAIFREGGTIIGVTTGAGIWAIAAVGVILGSGYVAAGVFFTLLILATLAAAGAVDRIAAGPCRCRRLLVTFDPAGGKTRHQIQSILDEHQHEGEVQFEEGSDGLGRMHITYCESHRTHRAFLGPLVALPQVKDARTD